MHNGGTMDTGDTSFVCTICYEIFLYPVCLPCGHRFCKLCLDKHIENNTMSCPICRFRVSNWLRQLRRSNAEVVDKPFWDTVQKLYPEQIKKRISGHEDCQSNLIYFRKRLATFDDKEKSRSASLHKAFLDLRYLQDQEDDWLGWSEPIFQVCRNVLQCAKDDPIVETPPHLNDTPRRRLAKQGEIHQEYEQFLQKEREEKIQEDEENLRLSRAMILMIEEEERREEEERIQQLLKDEELARRLEKEGAADSDRTPSERSSVQRKPRRRTRGSQKEEEEERIQQLLKDEELARRLEKEEELARRLEKEEAADSDRTPDELLQDDTDMCPLPSCSTPLHLPQTAICLDTPSTSKEVHQYPQSTICLNTSTPSTSKEIRDRCPLSPIPLDTQSTSKETVFSKFFVTGTSSPSSSRTIDKELSNQETALIDSKTSSISNKELSHFAPVQSGPSNITNGPKNKEVVVPPPSRCSSGCDSIGQELNHFKPIRCSPTTPPKDGSRDLVPKVVVAQRGVAVPDLNILPLSPLLSADVSLDELETSIKLEKQLEEDRKLAMEIQNQLNEEIKMPVKADYNLRKRKRPSGSLKKKVSLDRSQTTLDNLLIK